MVNEQEPLPARVPPTKVRLVAPATAVGGTPQPPLNPFGEAIFKPGARFTVKPTPVKGSLPEFCNPKVKVVGGNTVGDDNGIWLAPKVTPVNTGGPNAARAVSDVPDRRARDGAGSG